MIEGMEGNYMKNKFFGTMTFIIGIAIVFAFTVCDDLNGTGSNPGSSGGSTNEIVSSSGLVLVRIPGGTFQMGSPVGEPGRASNNDELQHLVTLSSFYMGKYEVTQAQYKKVMGTNPSHYSEGNKPPNWSEDLWPVEKVSWFSALIFCNKLSMSEGLSPAYSLNGKTNPDDWGTIPLTSQPAAWNDMTIVPGSNGYRLPTEAQWEYACRAGTTTAYNTGSEVTDSTGWYSANSNSRTHQIGQKQANDRGLYDMHGNVNEWCWDLYLSSYYSEPAATGPDPMGSSFGYSDSRVFRGGCWSTPALTGNMRSACRSLSNPGGVTEQTGFRVARPAQ
jgi:formylglycine-generating enzyme required for sulfatase activity